MSEIDFTDPISSLKSIISVQKIASKKALYDVLRILKKDAKTLELLNKEKKIEEDKIKYENGELEITFSVDGLNHENGIEKTDKISDSDSAQNNGNELNGSNTVNQQIEAEKEVEKEVEEEEELEEEVEEMPFLYSTANPIFMEIKAGTKEQSILESLDQVLTFNLFYYFIILLSFYYSIFIFIFINFIISLIFCFLFTFFLFLFIVPFL